MSHSIVLDMAECVQGCEVSEDRAMTITREEIMQALARAYCHDRNAKKEMDVDLLVAMADEVMKALGQPKEKDDGAVSTREDGDDSGSS
jgi:hypothetical protein